MRKKRVVYIFIILVSIGSFFLYLHSVGVNSGWDYSSSSSSDDSFFGTLILFIIVMILVVYFIRKNYKQTRKIKDSANTGLNQEYIKMEEKVRNVISNFNLEEFKNIVFEKYKEIQIAWMNFDYDTLRKNCTSSLYHMYRSQLEMFKLKKQKNIMSHFRQITFRVVDIEQSHKEVSLKVRTTIWCNDYIVDEEGHVVKGNKNKKSIYDYEMTFIRSIQENIQSKCPNCGAALERQNSVTCPYCNSNIVNDKNYDWVLSKKEMISQK